MLTFTAEKQLSTRDNLFSLARRVRHKRERSLASASLKIAPLSAIPLSVDGKLNCGFAVLPTYTQASTPQLYPAGIQNVKSEELDVEQFPKSIYTHLWN